MNAKPPAYYVFAVLTGLACIFLLVVAKESVEASWDRSLGSETPQQTTVEDLLAKGAGANRHVIVTQVAVGNDYLMSTRMGETENATWLIVSPAGTQPGTLGKSLLVHVTRFQDYATAQSNPEQQSFTGFYWEHADLPPAQNKLFAEKYPGLDFQTIPYLEVRDHKGTSGLRRAFYFALGGIPLLAIGIVGLVIIARRQRPPQAAKAS
jgi:hypothetical protein